MHTCYLLLGSNLGDKEGYLKSARDLINEQVGSILRSSSIYMTESWGFNASETFLNQVAMVTTQLSPHELLNTLLSIETFLGRERNGNSGFQSRVIDLDILFYADILVRTEKLSLPHPLLHKRRFVLVPLHEIANELIHPALNKNITQLLAECNDKLKVQLYQQTSNDFAISPNEIN